MKTTETTTIEWGEEAKRHKYGGDAMAAYLDHRQINGDHGDDMSTDGQGDGWVRFGRRVLRWDSTGFVECERFDSIGDAERWCWLHSLPSEWDCFISSRGDGTWWVECSDLSEFRHGRQLRHASLADVCQAIEQVMESEGTYPTTWVDGQAWSTLENVPLDEAYWDSMHWGELIAPVHVDPERFLAQVSAYLPSNYHASLIRRPLDRPYRADGTPRSPWSIHEPTTTVVRVSGRDRQGWTWEDYVKPRLASGLYFFIPGSERR